MWEGFVIPDFNVLSSFLITRVKKSNLANSGSTIKPGKKPKFVVHAAGDVGISGDGYRWRKYGQKMVKGNPHPRCMPNPLFNMLIFIFRRGCAYDTAIL